MTTRVVAMLLALTLLAAACGDDDTSEAEDQTPSGDSEGDAAPDDSSSDDAPSDDAPSDDTAGPVTGPSDIAADNQSGDGTTVVVASVSLPTAGFVVVHGDNEGGPGPVIGHSALLAAGDSTEVVVELDTPLEADGKVWPMAHVDANDNGEYEFAPPDVTTDAPATRADGSVAVIGIDYSLEEGAALELSASDLGDIVVDAEGYSLYLFVPDAQGDSTCYDQCEDAWPVVGELTSVGSGLDASLLGSTQRTTGDVQATYNSWPLYYFAGDAEPGDTNGQGVNDVWYVIDAAGDAIDG